MGRIKNNELAARLAKIDEESRAEDLVLWGGVQGMSGSDNVDLFRSPKFKEVVGILQQQPLLVQPVLNWLRQKQAELAQVQLKALYTPEQLDQMYAEAEFDE